MNILLRESKVRLCIEKLRDSIILHLTFILLADKTYSVYHIRDLKLTLVSVLIAVYI